MLLFLLTLIRCNVLPEAALGIDLGTTFSTGNIFTKIGNIPTLVPIKFGAHDIIPSAVRVETVAGEFVFLVGNDAKIAHTNDPKSDNYFSGTKRLIGQIVVDPDLKKAVSYEVVKEGGTLFINYKENGVVLTKLSPMNVATKIIAKFYDAVKNVYNIKKVVVTVPAYFGDNQKTATRNAALAAGIKDVILEYEPVAAALAYQHSEALGKPGVKYVVFDFGGGTLDATGVYYEHPILIADVIVGDNFLGGENVNH